MANETILIVDEDKKIQKVLEVSLRKAGYRILICDSTKDALNIVENETPDLVISETRFATAGDGFEFLSKIKAGVHKKTPFIFLTDDRALPQKMKGFELGADDYLTKPFYLKEITTRVDLLIQRNSEDIITQDNENEFSGQLSNVGVVDLLQQIEAEKSSGSIQIQRNEHNASIYFKNGNIFDAFCGKLSGEDAIYRLFFWPEGEFIVRYYDIGKRKDRIPKNCSELLIEGMDKLSRYQEISSTIQLNDIYDLDFERVAKVRSQLPQSVAEIFRLFNGDRSVRDVIDSSTIDDVSAIQIVKRVIDDGLVIQTRHGNTDSEKPNLATWLDNDDSVFESEDSELAEDTSLTFQVMDETTALKDEEPNRRDDPLFDATVRRTGTDKQHTITSEQSLLSIKEIEEQEEKRRAVEAQHLSGQHNAITPSDLEREKRRRRKTPIHSMMRASADELALQISEIDEDEANTAEIFGAKEAEVSMNKVSKGSHLSESETFEDSEPIEEALDGEVVQGRPFPEEEIPSTETPTKEIERVAVIDPEISEVDDDDTIEEVELAEDSAPLSETNDVELPFVKRNAVDGELVSSSFEIGKRSEIGETNRSEKIEKPETTPVEKIAVLDGAVKKTDSKIVTDEDFFSSAPDDDFSTTSSPNYWIPIILGVLLVGGYFLLRGSEETSDEVAIEQRAEVAAISPTIITEEQTIDKGPDETQVLANDGAANVEANSLQLAIKLDENKGVIEKEIEEDLAGKSEKMATENGTDNTENLKLKAEEKKPAQSEPEEKTEPKVASSFKARLSAANALVKKRKWNKALVALRKLSSEKSGSAKVAYLHGKAADRAGSTNEAIKQFSRAKKLGYKSASMMLELAAAHQFAGNRDKAKSAYEAFLKIQPTGKRADEVKSILENNY